MKNNNNTNKYWEHWREIKLSDASRVRMKNELTAYVSLHAVPEGVRMDAKSRSILQVPQRTLLFSLRFTYMPFFILIAVMIGGGTSFAAQSAVPGDFLYPVKTEVNESIRSAFAFGADAEARLQARLIEERVEEAKKLQARGELQGEAATTLATKLERNSNKARVALAQSAKIETQIEVDRIITAVTEYNAMVENRTNLVVSVDAFERIRVEGALSSEIAAGSQSLGDIESQTRSRLVGLQNVIAEHQAEISTSVRAEIGAHLERAERFSAEAAVAVEVDARRLYTEAARALGEVEAKLSTLGTMEINTSTGAIIDIDFGRVPPADRGDADTSTSSNASSRIDVNVDAGTSVNSDGGGASGSIRGGLGI